MWSSTHSHKHFSSKAACMDAQRCTGKQTTRVICSGVERESPSLPQPSQHLHLHPWCTTWAVTTETAQRNPQQTANSAPEQWGDNTTLTTFIRVLSQRNYLPPWWKKPTGCCLEGTFQSRASCTFHPSRSLPCYWAREAGRRLPGSACSQPPLGPCQSQTKAACPPNCSAAPTP